MAPEAENLIKEQTSLAHSNELEKQKSLLPSYNLNSSPPRIRKAPYSKDILKYDESLRTLETVVIPTANTRPDIDKTEIKRKTEETPSDTIASNLRKIKETPQEELQASFVSKTLELMLELIKQGTEQDILDIKDYIREYFSEGFVMKDMLRRELRVFMSDSELPEVVSARAMDLLPMLGSAKQKRPSASLLMTISELSKYEDETEEKPRTCESYTEDIESELLYPVEEDILTYLKASWNSEEKFDYCSKLIKNGVNCEKYIKLLDFNMLKSGRKPFDKIIPAAKAVLSAKRENFASALPAAEKALLFSLYYGSCLDILKMEAFEALKRNGFLNFNSAGIYKKYAIAFAKDALLNRSQGASCRALSNLLSLKSPVTSRTPSFENKRLDVLLEEFVSLMMKENDDSKISDALDILHHISADEPLLLRPLSQKIQPINYEKAIDLTAGLVVRKNAWASSILANAAGENYVDIRNKAVRQLSKCGCLMNGELKLKAIRTILNKAEECYDEDIEREYIEAAQKTDALMTAKVLIEFCASSGLADRKTRGSYLMSTLKILSPENFLELFSDISKLRTLHRFLVFGHKDKFTADFARQFIDLYRIHFSEVNGEETWTRLLSETKSDFVTLINELWNIQFQN